MHVHIVAENFCNSHYKNEIRGSVEKEQVYHLLFCSMGSSFRSRLIECEN